MWYNNHSRTKQSKLDSLLTLLAPPKKRQLPAYQAYYSLYNTKIAAVVNVEWPERWRTDHDGESATNPPPPPIHFRNAVAKRLLDAESDEIKNKVENFRRQQVEQMNEEAEGGEGSSQLVMAKTYQE